MISRDLLCLPVAAACVGCALLFWRWLASPVALPDVPGGRLACLSYTPFEPDDVPDDSPGWTSTPRIQADLRRLAGYTRCLRLYTPLGSTPRVVAEAAAQGFTVLLGAWIGSDLTQNELEIAGAVDLAHRYPRTIRAIVVGNEVLLRREMSAGRLAALIAGVREQSPVPVAYADVAQFIEASPEVARAADLLLIHLLPYWDVPAPPAVGAAVDQVLRSYETFRARFPGKQVMIGETGWPSAGRGRGAAQPGRINQARFVREFAVRAGAARIPYNIIEAIDQPWKRRSEGTVGGYWGVLDRRREPKFGLAGPVSGQPDWRPSFLATAAVSLLVLGAGLRRRPAPRAWPAWGALGLGLGLALVFQWHYALTTTRSALGWAFAGASAITSVIAAAILAPGGHSTGPATLADLGKSLGRLRAVPASAALLAAGYVALVTLPAAWLALTLAFDARHRDVPVAQFALPALAIALRLSPGRDARRGERPEEAVLAGLLVSCGLMQLEMANPETWAWLAICALLAVPWRGELGAGLRLPRRPTATRQPQQGSEHA